MAAHGLGRSSLMTSTGMAETYASPSTVWPLVRARCLMVPSSLSTNSLRRELSVSSPPRAEKWSTMGWHRRSGGEPSKNAILLPCCSWRKRFSAVNTTVMESSPGSMKARALAMAMKTSSFTRSGTPCFFIHCVTVNSSCSSQYFWPKMMAGSRPIANWIFSGQVSIWLFRRMATMPFQGAGSSGKSKRENSPGISGLAKIIACSFHCSLFSMPSSLNRF
mmetsp:Transcript_11126/g.19424  ORF Transcript_11126/g.19424 Transcript_11126/m.19424 type:complete len:220 (+) Transcript_11126:959-1618(+)